MSVPTHPSAAPVARGLLPMSFGSYVLEGEWKISLLSCDCQVEHGPDAGWKHCCRLISPAGDLLHLSLTFSAQDSFGILITAQLQGDCLLCSFLPPSLYFLRYTTFFGVEPDPTDVRTFGGSLFLRFCYLDFNKCVTLADMDTPRNPWEPLTAA